MAIELDTTQIYDARIRVVGVGGGGGNAVRTMITRGLEGVEFVAANTDRQALMSNPAGIKIQLGKETTRGLGAGANPEVGRKSVEENIDDVRESLQGSDMIFVTAGMGGGTGTGAAPVIARVGKELGALVVGIVTKPFNYESKRRGAFAEAGIKELRENVDALIVIPNERILSIIDPKLPVMAALGLVDQVLYNATKGIADIISGVGYVNVDFADVRSVMSNMGDALMGIGVGTGERRAIEAAHNALNSPILEGMQIYGAKGLLVNVSGGPTMSMHEVSEAVKAIEQAAGEEVNLIHGVVIDDTMDEEISITVVATGFHREGYSKAYTDKPAAQSVSIVNTKPVVEERENSEPIPVVEDSKPQPRVFEVSRPIDREDKELPAVWRNNQIASQQPNKPQSPTSQGTVPPASQHVNDTYPVSKPATSQTQFLGSKQASAGGSSQPSFLRKIMD